MPITAEVRRLQVVHKDFGESTIKFAKVFGIGARSIQRMLKGEQEINYTVVSGVCLKLGYSPSWFLLGIGHKKLKGDDAKLITEIQMLRAEMDIMAKLNMKLQARITGIEKEVDELKPQKK